ncbi:MAG: hypothetical protein H0W63_04315 [Gemmatimonadaceae bacterium]|nr:hypothetical protein [Gemmatimonadaceae bacterium]
MTKAGFFALSAAFVALNLSALRASGQEPRPRLPQPILLRSTYEFVRPEHDTVLQNVLRTPGGFASDVLLPKLDVALQFTGQLGPQGVIQRLETDVWRANVHAQHGTYVLKGDSVFGRVSGSGRSQDQNFPAAGTPVIMQFNFVAFLEQLLQRARALGGDSVGFPVYLYGTAGVIDTARVRFTRSADSAFLRLGRTRYDFALDSWGRISSGSWGAARLRRLSYRRIMPDDPARIRNACPAPGTRAEIASLIADRAVKSLLNEYGVRNARISEARWASRADSTACDDLLDMFPQRNNPFRIYVFNDVYIIVSGRPEESTAIIVGDSSSIAQVVPLAPAKPKARP